MQDALTQSIFGGGMLPPNAKGVDKAYDKEVRFGLRYGSRSRCLFSPTQSCFDAAPALFDTAPARLEAAPGRRVSCLEAGWPLCLSHTYP